MLCGGIANYNAAEPPPGPEAIGALAGWVQAGKLKTKVDTQHGLENAPETLRRLFEGRNEGKQLLRVAE